MASLSAVKNKVSIFHALHERVLERTSIKMKGYVAVQRKLLVLMYTLWKKNELFNPNFNNSGNQEIEALCSVALIGAKKETAESNDSAALDGLPLNQSTEALCSVL